MQKEHGAAIGVMQAIKQAIDPRGIMNPGKIWFDLGDNTISTNESKA